MDSVAPSMELRDAGGVGAHGLVLGASLLVFILHLAQPLLDQDARFPFGRLIADRLRPPLVLGPGARGVGQPEPRLFAVDAYF
jgi:hypothetical protein